MPESEASGWCLRVKKSSLSVTWLVLGVFILMSFDVASSCCRLSSNLAHSGFLDGAGVLVCTRNSGPSISVPGSSAFCSIPLSSNIFTTITQASYNIIPFELAHTTERRSSASSDHHSNCLRCAMQCKTGTAALVTANSALQLYNMET